MMPHPRSRWTLLAAAVTALVAASCSEATIPVPPEAESPLFEVEYINYAWAPTWEGFYVDREGRVFSYDLGGSRDQELADSVLTPAQLARKYEHGRTLVKTLPAGEAERMYERVGAAQFGPFTEQKFACADAGGRQYSAWIYRESDGRYHRLLLHLRGDLAQANRSPAARELYHWLEDATGTADPGAGCDPYAD
ncbi:MAG TPA: hypothetical protein VF541_10090 [Longimicrobium sp.]|jgi:hypothetical protein